MSLLKHSVGYQPFRPQLHAVRLPRTEYRDRTSPRLTTVCPICRSSGDAASTGSSGNLQLRITTRKALKQLSSLKLAIAELATIAGLSAIGTIVKQNESVEFYVQNYPGAALASHDNWHTSCSEVSALHSPSPQDHLHGTSDNARNPCQSPVHDISRTEMGP